MNVLDPLCERARCVASLRLDAEATEFESAFLDSHLASCGACRAYVAGIGASAERLRSAPLEPYQTPFARPRGRRGTRHLQVVAAALFVAGAGLTGLASLPRSGDVVGSAPATRPAYLDSQNYDQTFIREATARPVVHGGTLGTRPS